MNHLHRCYPELVIYIQEKIIPKYKHFDKAHQEDHVNQVIKNSIELAVIYNADINMALTIAAYHDLGLAHGREFHHIHSGDILEDDKHIRQWFDEDQIKIMRDAIEDHRASIKHEPRSIYGKIVAEADRVIDLEKTLRRTVQYGLKHYPDMQKDEHFERFRNHIIEKYGENGYLKLWLSLPSNEEELIKIRELIKIGRAHV